MTRLRPLLIALPLALLAASTFSCSRHTASKAGALPVGYVDLPKPGQTLAEGAQITGWALSPQGIEEIAVYVDGQYVQSAILGGSRPDVKKAFPNIPNSAFGGWSAPFRAGSLPAGEHELLIQARTSTGASRDLARFPVTLKR